MARIRTIKPGFFRSEDVSVLPMRARLTWIGLWTQCDDQGRTKDNVKLIKADVWPLDSVTLAEIEEDLVTLTDHGRIVRYEVAGARYLEVTNWSDHQSINRPTPSKIPPPPVDNPEDNPAACPQGQSASKSSLNGSYPHVNTHGGITEGSPQEGKGKEGKGRDAGARASPPPEPPSQPASKCPRHINDPNPPNCGPCADHRRAHDRWATERADRQLALPRCELHPGQLAHSCAGCRADQLAADSEPATRGAMP